MAYHELQHHDRKYWFKRNCVAAAQKSTVDPRLGALCKQLAARVWLAEMADTGDKDQKPLLSCMVVFTPHQRARLLCVDDEGGGGGRVRLPDIRHHQHLRRGLPGPQRVKLHLRVEGRNADPGARPACSAATKGSL